MKPHDLTFEKISIGAEASFGWVFEEKDIQTFAELTGDHNPLHLDAAYAATTPFGQRLVHGMLVAGLCSTLVGMYLPGKRCLYLGQTLEFKEPVFIGDHLDVSGTVTAKSLSTRMLTVVISIKHGDKEAVRGVATVKVLE